MKTLLHLKAKAECHWPMGRGPDGSRLFCAALAVPNGDAPYCPTHLKAAYRYTPRSSQQAQAHLARLQAGHHKSKLNWRTEPEKVAA